MDQLNAFEKEFESPLEKEQKRQKKVFRNFMTIKLIKSYHCQ